VYYVWQEERPDLELENTIACARLELEKVNAKTEGWSLIPLSYSLGPVERALKTTGRGQDSAASDLSALDSKGSACCSWRSPR
jgi:hypothetical protein